MRFWRDRRRDSEVGGVGFMYVDAGIGRFNGVEGGFRGRRGGFGKAWTGESSISLTGAVLRGDAPGGLAFGVKGVRMGDLKGLLTDPLRRRRFAGVSMVRWSMRSCGLTPVYGTFDLSFVFQPVVNCWCWCWCWL